MIGVGLCLAVAHMNLSFAVHRKITMTASGPYKAPLAVFQTGGFIFVLTSCLLLAVLSLISLLIYSDAVVCDTDARVGTVSEMALIVCPCCS